MIVMSYVFADVCSSISRIGSPARTTISGETPKRRSFPASLSSASRNGFSSSGLSEIPSNVVSALVGPATSPATMTGLSAGSVPSLQIRIRIRLEFVSRDEGVDDDGGADERQRHKSEPDFWAREILGRNRADLRADGSPGVHDERDQNVDVASEGVAECSVAGRDDDLEKIGTHREMGWNTEDINQHRHADVARAATQKTTKQTADERNHDDHPKRDRFYAGGRQRNHWPDFQTLDRLGPMAEGRFVSLRRRAGRLAAWTAFLLKLQCPPGFPDYEAGDAHVDGNRHHADDEVHVAGALQHLDDLRANLGAPHRSNGHDQSQLQVDIAEGPVPLRRHHRLAHDMGEIRADSKIPVQADSPERGSRDETASHAEKSPQHSDEEPDRHEVDGADVGVGDR